MDRFYLRPGHLLIGVVLLAALVFSFAAPAQVPDKFTNLKVIPKDIGKKQLVDEMKAWTFALGTRCWYCHDGEGDDLSTFDFAADTKPTKAVARLHLRLRQEVNQNYFDGGSTVTCNTCHKGQAKPAP